MKFYDRRQNCMGARLRGSIYSISFSASSRPFSLKNSNSKENSQADQKYLQKLDPWTWSYLDQVFRSQSKIWEPDSNNLIKMLNDSQRNSEIPSNLVLYVLRIVKSKNYV